MSISSVKTYQPVAAGTKTSSRFSAKDSRSDKKIEAKARETLVRTAASSRGDVESLARRMRLQDEVIALIQEAKELNQNLDQMLLDVENLRKENERSYLRLSGMIKRFGR